MAKAVKLRVEGPGPKVNLSKDIIAPKTVANERADVRDILSMLSGGGNTDLTNPDIRGSFLRLSGIMGKEKAQQLFNHVVLFNQRPEVQKLNPEQRVQTFFELGSANPDIKNQLKEGKSIGYGVLNGFRTSPLIGNMQLTGRRSASDEVPNSGVGEKIKLLVNRNTK